MNEEEKKLVEELSKKAVFCNYEERDYPSMICFKKDMLIVLNLIEKLQKENEELNKENEQYRTEVNCTEKFKQENELLRKDIEGWEKYCEEINEEQTEMSNKNCELEFEVEKLQKENEELKYKYDKALSDVIAGIDLDNSYIPVQKIKDKMEKLNKEIKNAEVTEAILKIKQQQVLQELIEESGKNKNVWNI